MKDENWRPFCFSLFDGEEYGFCKGLRRKDSFDKFCMECPFGSNQRVKDGIKFYEDHNKPTNFIMYQGEELEKAILSAKPIVRK